MIVAGDFDGDGDFDVDDLDSLVANIAAGTADPVFDLNQDGSVDLADRDAWLSIAGEANLGPGRAYRVGDVNLDSFVDGIDFIAWNNNKFTAGGLWSGGDFNADGFTDGQDFILWNMNKFTTADLRGIAPNVATIAASRIVSDRWSPASTVGESTSEHHREDQDLSFVDEVFRQLDVMRNA